MVFIKLRVNGKADKTFFCFCYYTRGTRVFCVYRYISNQLYGFGNGVE